MRAKYSSKIYVLTILLIIVIFVLTDKVFATTITKEKLQENMNGYVTGNKKATAMLSNGSSVSIGGDSSSGGSVTIDDKTVKYVYEGYNISGTYTLSDTEASFTVDTSIEGVSKEQATIEALKPSVLLPLFFLGITDEQGVNSNDALYYFENEISNSSTSANNDIFSYTMTGDTTKATYVLKINLNADFSAISSTKNKPNDSDNSTTGIISDNETNETNDTLDSNEIFDQNKSSDKDIPDAGPEKWVPISIVAVGLIIILIIIMDIINTRKIKMQ